jgi:hypothetical protein
MKKKVNIKTCQDCKCVGYEVIFHINDIYISFVVEKRIIKEQSRNTKEEKLRTKTYGFYVGNPQGEENSRPLSK